MKIPTELPIPFHSTFQIMDSSKLQQFVECRRKFFYKYVLGWVIDEPNVHLIFGESWHRAQEHLLINGYSTKSVREAYEKFLDYYRRFYPEVMDVANHPKSPANALQALSEYVGKYTDDDFEIAYPETVGTVPVDDRRVLHYRIDGIIKGDRGYYCKENKTGSRLTRVWVDQFTLTQQTGTYTHVLYSLYSANQVYGIVIDGVIFRKNDVEFIRIPIRKTEGAMRDWLWTTLHHLDMIEWDFDELSRCSKDDEVLMAFPKCVESCTKYMRLCPYFDFCTTWANPLPRADDVPPGYTVERWNPADREEDAKDVLHIKVEDVEKSGE